MLNTVENKKVSKLNNNTLFEAVLVKDISYLNGVETLIGSKGDKILIDRVKDIALLPNGDHVDVFQHEYQLVLR